MKSNNTLKRVRNILAVIAVIVLWFFKQYYLAPESYYNYYPLDSLGRTTGASVRITYNEVLKSAGHREDIPRDQTPSGWYDPVSGRSWNSIYGQVDLNVGTDKHYRGWFYNRSHLIADSLGGKPIRENLITGTRQQNVGNNIDAQGMREPEVLALTYLRENPDSWVDYKVDVFYQEDELVPRYVTVHVVTGNGKTNKVYKINNVAAGYVIDYKTGEVKKEE